MNEKERKKIEESKPKSRSRKWDIVNDDILKTLKHQGQDITLALSDPSQALIVVPQKLAIQTIGNNTDLHELLSLTNKNSYHYIRNLCFNHLNNSRRQYFLKKSTHVYLQQEYNVNVNVNGTYISDYSESNYGGDIDSFLNDNRINSISSNKLPLHLVIRATNTKELETALNAIKEMFECSLTLQIYPPILENDADYSSFYRLLKGKDRINLNYIESHTLTKISIKGKGSDEINNDSSLPLHIIIDGVVPVALMKAKKLCDSLIETIKMKWFHGKRG